MESKKNIEAKELKVYNLARQLLSMGWKINESPSWQDKKIMSNQFIESTDSIGANIIEGYGRFHFLDKIPFYYISKASFNESISHWLELLFERVKLKKEKLEEMTIVAKELEIKLNNFMGTSYNQYKKTQNNER